MYAMGTHTPSLSSPASYGIEITVHNYLVFNTKTLCLKCTNMSRVRLSRGPLSGQMP